MTEDDLRQRVDDYIRRAAVRPWGPGESKDCCLVLADWAREITGVDPIAELRGSYAGWLQAARRMHRAGGLVPILGPIAAAAGWRPVARPSTGAIGVVGDPARPIRQYGALYDGWGWVIFLRASTVTAPTDGGSALAVWDVPSWAR